VDLGLVAYPTRRAGLQIEIFEEAPLVLICHPSHILAQREQMPIKALSGENFIAFEPDLPTRKAIDRYLKEQGVEVVQAMEFDNIETVKRAVEIESGVSIVPSNTVIQEVASGALAAVRLEGSNLCRPLGLISKSSRPSTPAQREFLAALRGKLEM
jgi:DNA-binding transcriptional LysR family regulator